MQEKPLITKRQIVLAMGGVLLIVLAYFLYSYSYVQVKVGQDATGPYTIQLQSDDTEVHTSSDTTYKKLVKRGTYEVMVASKDGKGYFSVSDAGGWLSTTTVEAKLSPQKNREFIGNSPLSCMHVIDLRLVSHACGDTVSRAFLHVPSTRTTPTYTKPLETTFPGNIEGRLRLGAKDYLILRAPLDGYEQPPHSAHTVSSDGKLGPPTALKGLGRDRSYTFMAYREGFVAISLTEAFYFSDVSAVPESIAKPPQDEDSYRPYTQDAHQNTIAIAYTDGKKQDVDEEDASGAQQRKSKVWVHNSGKSSQFYFDKTYSTMKICGDTFLCLLADQTLRVYDISGEKARFLYTIQGVNSLENQGGSLVVARQNEVLRLNVADRSGTVDYVYGDYSYCGLRVQSQAGYVLCVKNTRNKTSALYFSNSAESNDIDQSVAELLAAKEVNDVSVYRNIVFVSPALNEESVGTTVLSAAEKQARQTVNNKIKSLVNQSGIDQQKYQIINPFD